MPDLPDVLQLAAVMAILCLPILAFTVGLPLGRAWAERLKRAAAPAADVAALEARLGARLQQLALHVDALAIEVERVGESQRFLARALAERLAVPPPHAAAPPARVVTPH